MIDKLIAVDLREIWKNEARNFTSWLFNNLDILNEQIGLDLSSLETEKSAGVFSVDILAEDRSGRLVIIENQLEKTDHDHLGKVLTYLANLNAKIGIWISPDPRPEHAKTINYLNEIAPDDTHFFLIKIQAFKIGESKPAPFFSIIAGPNPEVTAGGKIKKELAERDQKRYIFFEQLLTLSNKKTNLFNNISPNAYQGWVGAGAGKFGLAWNYVIMLSKSRIEFFICSPDAEINKKRFEYFLSHKNEVENDFGEKLDWDFKEGRKQHYIKSWSNIGGLQNEEKWLKIQEDLTNKMVRLEKVLHKYIVKINNL